jgi:RHS repeat-associated protein
MKRVQFGLAGLFVVILLVPGVAAAAPGGSISGTVTAAAGGAAIAGIEICAVGSQPSGTEACAATSNSGEYAIGGLPDGSYEVFFFAPEGSGLDYIGQSYPHPVTVANGTVTQHIDAALVVGAAVEGKVTGGGSTTPLQGIEVCATSAGGPNPFEFSEFCATTEAAGKYRLAGIPSGEYHVDFFPPYRSQLNYLSQYYSGKASSAEADPVAVTAGQTNIGVDANLVTGGQVGGRVTSAVSSAGLAGVEVCAEPITQGRGNCATSDATGAYTIAGLASGSYKVEFTVPSQGTLNYVRQYYDAESSYSGADAVSVTAGQTTSSIDAAMHLGGTIAGKVTTAPGKTPLTATEVCASGGETYRCAQTDGAGEYSITALPTGTYNVHFLGDEGHAAQYFKEAVHYSEAHAVQVTAGAGTSGIDAELQLAGKIKGTVTAAGSGAPLERIRVCRYPIGEEFESFCSYTNAAGEYEMRGLLATSYKLEFSGEGGNYLTQFYRGKGSLTEAEPLTVAAGETKSGIDAALQAGGQIKGKVTSAVGGAPAAGVSVTAYTSSGTYVTSTTTNAGGEYALSRLATGHYKVDFTSGSTNLVGEYFDDKATLGAASEINVTSGSVVTGIDAALALGGEIKGKVSEAGHGAGLAYANVSILSSSGAGVANVSSDAAGNYVVRGLAEGSYKVEFFDSGFESQYYAGKSSLAAADPVAVQSGNATTGIDAAMKPLASISGTVTDAVTHAGLEYVEVCAFPHEGSGEACGTTNASGHYTVSLYTAGRYSVEFFPSGDYLGQYYDDKESFGEAEELTVGAGAAVTGIDGALVHAGHIKGTVTASSGGAALEGIEVCAESTGDGPFSCAFTEAGGAYEIGGLSTGSYRVHFIPDESGPASNFVGQYYNGRSAVGEANPVAVTAGATTAGIDAALVGGGVIRGRISSAGTDSPLGDAEACAYDPEGSAYRCADTGPQGEYAIDGLAAGEYVVYFLELGGGEVSYYDGAFGPGEATKVKVTPPATRTGIDGRLHANGHIAGTVTSSAAGEPAVGVEVCALSPEGFQQSCATTGASGTYSLAVASGKHEVEFRSPTQRFETQYYDGVPSATEAQLVEVGEAETKEGIDAAMVGPGEIAGRVTEAGTGAGLAGISVCALPAEGFVSGHCAQSGPNGEYAIPNLASGGWKVSFSAPTGMNFIAQYYAGKATYAEATTVTTTPGSVTAGIDAALQVGGEIKGKVTAKASGAPIAGIEVCPVPVATTPPGGGSPAPAAAYSGGCAVTGASGEYTAEKMPTGEYRVYFTPPFNSTLNYLRQSYAGKSRISEGTPIAVVAGGVRSGIDAALDPGGEISGKVTRIGTKAPLQGVQVCPYSATGEFESSASCVLTDANGGYTVRGLPTGQEKLVYYLYGYFQRWYKEATDSSGAVAVAAEVGHDTPGIDVALKSEHPIVPTVISAPTVTGAAEQGGTLAEHHGSWTNEPTEYHYRWLRCDASGQNCLPTFTFADQSYVPTTADVGDTIEVEETAVNLEGESLPSVSPPTAVVVPAPPVEITPPRIEGRAQTGNVLKVLHGEWTNDPTSYTHRWERCGEDGSGCTLISGATGETFALTPIDVGHTIRTVETATNGGGESEPAVSTASTVVLPAPPVDQTLPTVAGIPVQGGNLTAGHGSWSGEPTSYEYQWERCSASGTGCEPISGQAGAEYRPVAADVGHELVVAVIAINSGGASSPASSAPTSAVVAAAPENVVEPTIGGQLREGGTVTADQGFWSNEPTSYAYQWERCSAAGNSCTPIAGATEPTYVAVAADIGHRLVVQVTASNAGGAGAPADSAPSRIVVAGVPVNLSPPRISGEALQGEFLIEERGTWTNQPTDYDFEWQRCDVGGGNCVEIEGAFGSEYVPDAADVGHTIRVLETAVNAGGSSDPAPSAVTATIVGAVPVAESRPTIFGEPEQGETLTEQNAIWTNEPSGYSYQWERCDAGGGSCVSIAGATASAYLLTGADVGHRLVVVETAENPAGAGVAVSEPSEKIEPAVPVEIEAPTVSGTVRVGSTLTEAHGDWSHQPTSFAYQWHRCGESQPACEEIPGATGQSYTPVAGDLGAILFVVETASNASGSGTPASSVLLGPVAPEPPVASTPPQLAGTPQTGETLTVAQVGGWSHEPTSYREQWLRCNAGGGSCTAIGEAEGFAYSPVGADVGHTLRVREIAVNAGGEGEPIESAPSAPVVAAPLKAVAGEDIRTTVGAPVTLNGSGSSPAAEISGEHWTFGDGSGGDGGILTHTYAAAGQYTAKLTVERRGESREASVTVTVVPPPPRQTTITVVDENGHSVGGAEVLFIGADGARIEGQTNGAGEAKLAGLPDGEDAVYAYAGEFRPKTGKVTVSEGGGETTIELAHGQLGTVGVTSHEMNLAEIEAAGIDPNDPANRQVFYFETHLVFDLGVPALRCAENSLGEFVVNCGGGGGWRCTRNVCSSGSSTVVGGSVPGDGGGGGGGSHPFIEEIAMPGKVTTLKQFFELSVVVTNLSPEPFKFSHGELSLALPEGMSLAPTRDPQAMTQSVADVPGEGSVAAKWVIRGDTPGEYLPAVEYGAQLEPFAKHFSLKGAVLTPLKVWGAEAFGFDVQGESGSLKEGVPYHVRIGIVDEAPIPFYNVSVGIDGSVHDGFIYQPDQEFEASVAELRPAQTIFAPEDILVPDADGGTFDPARSYARFAGEPIVPGEGIEAVAPEPLYALTATLSSATMIHLHWQPSPGAEGYEVFSTPELSTSFEATADAVRTSPSASGTVTRLGASATDAYIPRGVADPPRFYAVATVIHGKLRLEHPVREPSIQGPIGGSLTLRELLAGGHNPAEFCLQCSMDRILHGDPVDAPTGNFWESVKDLSVSGRGPALELARTYNSQAAGADSPFGHGWSFTYGMSLDDGSGQVEIDQENGSAVVFTEEPDGSFVAPPRVTATLRHEEDGTWSFVRHRREIFTFGAAGELTGEEDLNGYRTDLAYDGSGQLKTVTDPAGRKLTFAWSGGHITSVTDPLGRKVEYAYDGAGDLTEVHDVAGGDTHFTYDASHRMLTARTPDQAPGVAGSSGKTVTNVYDDQGRVAEQTDQLGRKTTFAYAGEPLGDAGGTTTITDPEGHVTVQSYRYGELLSETQGQGTADAATWKFAYDPESLGLTEVIDPNGHATKSTYDAEGNLLTSEDALGRRTVDTYDRLNDLLSTTDPTGVATTFTYDGRGNLLTTSRPLSGSGETQITTYAYGDSAHPGDVTSMTDPDGKTWHYAYDADGDLTSTVDPLGNEESATYDAIGRRLTSTSPRGNAVGFDAAEFTTTYAYDPFGQVTETVDPLGHKTIDEYDPDQNLVATVDPNGHATHYEYDAADERVAVRRADGTTLHTTYTPDGAVKEQIDAAGHATTYAYDALGRVATETDPLGRSTHYGYDPAGNETSMTDPAGQVTTKAYDAADELTSVTYSDGKTPAVTGITYDGDGERTGMTDGTGTWSWSWDSLHRLTAATEGGSGTVGYAYDLDGHMLAVAYPNGKTATREYDGAGDLTAVKDWLGNTTTFSYDPDSELSGESFPGGVATTLEHDAADRLGLIQDSRPGASLATFGYARDADGQVTKEAVDNGGSSTSTYSYDSLDRLASATGDPYAYDSADNPIGFGAGTTQSFDAAGQLTGRTEPGEGGETPGGGGGGGEPPGGGSPGGGSGGEPLPNPDGGTTPTAPVAPAPDVGGSHPELAPPATRAAVHAVSKSGSVKSPRVHVHDAGELLLAFVSASGPASGQHVAQLTGPLHWSLVARQAVPGGDAEVWQAQSTHSGAGQVTANLADPGYRATMAIENYGSAAALKSHAVAHGQGSPPSLTLPNVGGALLVGVGVSSGQKGAVAPVSQQKLLGKFTGSGGAAGWVQEGVSTTGRVGDARPAANWGMVAVAIATTAKPGATAGQSRGALPLKSSASSAPNSSAPAGASGDTVESGPRRTAAAHAVAAASPSGTVTRHFTYNSRGDRTGESGGTGPTRSLTYDQANRLIGVGTEVTYSYDGDGLRMSKKVGDGTTSFAWSEAEELPQLLQAGPTSYIYGPEGTPIEQISGTTATFLHQDQQGSTRLITDATGAVVGRYDFGPWGAVASHTGAATDLQFDGQYTDAETGFQYLRARYYDPTTGQFLTVDPASWMTQSRYEYANDNALSLGDPSGLWSFNVCFGGCISYKSGGAGWGTGVGLGASVEAGFVSVGAGASFLGYPHNGEISVSGGFDDLVSGEFDTGDGHTTLEICGGLRRVKYVSLCTPTNSGGGGPNRKQPNPMPMFTNAHNMWADQNFKGTNPCPR